MRILVTFIALLFVITFIGGLFFDSMISGGLVSAVCFTVFLVAIYAYFNKFN